MSAATAKPSIADTFTRLLRLNVAAGPPRVSRARLMVESEAQLARAARGGSASQQQIAGPILANPAEYRRWEAEHGRLITAIASPATGDRQARALLSAAFSLVHRKALFEYLRGHAPRGNDRRILIQHFHGYKSYTQAVVAEHGNYMRGAASLICIEHLGATILTHQALGEPFRRYEQLYAEYFRSYCDSYLAPPVDGDDSSDSIRMLLPYLKRDVLEVRARLLAMPAVAEPGAHHATR